MWKVKNFKTHAFITKNCYDLLSETDYPYPLVRLSNSEKKEKKRIKYVKKKKKKKGNNNHHKWIKVK